MNFLIKTALKLVFLLIIAIVGYNFFWGTAEEKENSKKIFNQVKELGGDFYGLLASEKSKFDEGKYDEVADKLESTFKKLQDQSSKLASGGKKYAGQFNSMGKQLKELEDQLARLNAAGGNMKNGNPSTGGRYAARGYVASNPADLNADQIKQKMSDLYQQMGTLGKEMSDQE